MLFSSVKRAKALFPLISGSFSLFRQILYGLFLSGFPDCYPAFAMVYFL